jgi:hypothetical protein
MESAEKAREMINSAYSNCKTQLEAVHRALDICNNTIALKLEDLQTKINDREKFPEMDNELTTHMKQEIENWKEVRTEIKKHLKKN